MNWRLAKYGVPTGKATMAQAVKYVTGFASLIVLLIVAVLLVTIDGQLNRWIILMSSTLVTVMIAVTIGGIYLMSNPPRMHRVAQRISRGCNKIVRKLTFGQVQQVIKPSKVVEFLDDMSDDYESMMRDKRVLLQPFLWGLFFTSG
jgi:c-di-AMP phosphodiesterase-like protein